MKKVFVSIICSALLTFSCSSVYSYELSEKDYEIIEKFDEKIITLIDTSTNLSAQRVVDVFNNFLEKKETPERFEKIIRTVIDDIKYEYYLGEYSQGAISADDCYEDEYFDVKNGFCYLLDDSDNESEDNEANNYLSDDHDGKHNAEKAEDENFLAKYNISENDIILLDGVNDVRYRELWKLFATIIPKDYRKDFKQFAVFNNPESDTDAHVAQDEEDQKKWNLTVNLVGFYNEQGQLEKSRSIETLIHEFAHVLTLSKTQVKYIPLTASDDFWNKVQENCNGYFVSEGCLGDNAYLQAFITTFWQEDFIASQDEEVDDFYSGNENNYVTEYASTNPGEDIAESFAYFILKPKSFGDSIADQKVNFFYNYPDLVKLRNFIRMRIQ